MQQQVSNKTNEQQVSNKINAAANNSNDKDRYEVEQ